MCGSSKAPKVVERDPVADQRAAEAQAASAANLELAARRRRRRESSLLTMGSQGLTGSNGVRSLLASAVAKPMGGG